MQRYLLLTMFVVLCLPMGTSAAKVLAPDGPYSVGVRIEHVAYQGGTLPVMFWYPARIPEEEAPYKYPSGVRGSAVLEAQPSRAETPYPIILFSHGFTACGFQSLFFTENLASHGYVVAAPDYKDAMLCKIEGEPELGMCKFFWFVLKSGMNLKRAANALYQKSFKDRINDDFSYRAIEAGKVLDQIMAWNEDPSFPLRGMMDPERIGATGHSLGGYTSLVIGGMPFLCDPERPPDDCNPDMNLIDRNPCCNQAVRQMKDPFQLRDPRVKAILPLGTSVIFPDIEAGASKMEIPVMVITGDSKRFEAPWEPIRALFDNAPPPKLLVRLKKTDHVTVVDGVKVFHNPIIRLFMPGFRKHYAEKAQAYKDYSVAFFDLFLKGKGESAAILQTPSNRFVELWSEVK